jgi:hypothetical protein
MDRVLYYVKQLSLEETLVSLPIIHLNGNLGHGYHPAQPGSGVKRRVR